MVRASFVGDGDMMWYATNEKKVSEVVCHWETRAHVGGDGCDDRGQLSGCFYLNKFDATDFVVEWRRSSFMIVTLNVSCYEICIHLAALKSFLRSLVSVKSHSTSM